MCRIEDCNRHEYDRGLCLVHLKVSEWYLALQDEPVKPKRKSRKKKVDTVEVTTNDETTELETREAE